MEAPQNSLLAKSYQRRTQSPEAAHHVQRQDRADEISHGIRMPFGEHSGIEKEKAHRHDHAEKEKHLVAQSELHAHAGKGDEVRQSRKLLPVSSMNTSSSEGVAISRLTSSLPCASSDLTREK